MENYKGFISILVVLSCLFSCKVDESLYLDKVSDPAHLHKAQKMLTDVMVHDIFSPPVASRIYVYSSIAAFETMVSGNSDFNSLAGQLTGLEKIPSPGQGQKICFPIAAVHAYVKVGTRIIFSEENMNDFIEGRISKPMMLDNASIPMLWATNIIFNKSIWRIFISNHGLDSILARGLLNRKKNSYHVYTTKYAHSKVYRFLVQVFFLVSSNYVV
jgi:hypothetical protein